MDVASYTTAPRNHAKVRVLRAEVFPSGEKCLPVHLRRLHELVDGDRDLEGQLVWLPVHVEAQVEVWNEEIVI